MLKILWNIIVCLLVLFAIIGDITMVDKLDKPIEGKRYITQYDIDTNAVNNIIKKREN